MAAPGSVPVCARCAHPLPDNWAWAKDADGQFTGQAVCLSCTKRGETLNKAEAA